MKRSRDYPDNSIVEIGQNIKKSWRLGGDLLSLRLQWKTIKLTLVDLEVGGREETIQTTASLRTARILRKVLETRGNLLSLRLLWKTIRLTLVDLEVGGREEAIETTASLRTARILRKVLET